MWLIVTFIATLLSAGAFFRFKDQWKRLKLGLLVLMMLGTFLMVLVDHLIAFFEGEPLIEVTTEGLMHNPIILGVFMVIPLVMIWSVAVIYSLMRKAAL